MNDDHQHVGSAPATSERRADRHGTTDRDVYLLVALEVGAILLWAFWDVVDVALEVQSGSGTREVGLVAIVLTTTMVVVAAFAARWLLGPRRLRTWTITAAAVWIASCAGPLTATTPTAGVALLTFHLLVGAGLIAGVRHLHRTAR
jgi:uncharacterized membrane protein YhaH (DUF805 family)